MKSKSHKNVSNNINIEELHEIGGIDQLRANLQDQLCRFDEILGRKLYTELDKATLGQDVELINVVLESVASLRSVSSSKKTHIKKVFQRLIKDAQAGDIGWKHTSFEDARKQFETQIRNIANPISVEEGVFVCKKCKSKRVYSIQHQTRSADEQMTTFLTCMQCNARWKD